MKSSKLLRRLKSAVVGAAVTATALVAPLAMPEKNADAAVNINYAKALQYSLYLYDANMCGTEVGEKSQLDWRDDCHTYDSKVSTPYGVLDLSGGFHDCGDHVKFGITGAYSATMLGWSYYEFKDAFTKTGQADHLKTITDYFCDFYKRCTVMDGSSVKAFCYQVGDGNTDHDSWQPPEKDTMDRPALFATSSNPCTDVVAETAAALAMNYLNFGNKEDLDYAKALYSFAKSNNKSNHNVAPFYQGTSYLDDLALAAITLYKATNDSSYKTDCGNWISESNWSYTTRQPLCWDSVWPAVNALYANEWNRVAENIDNNKSNTNSEGYYCQDNWGSARYNAALQLEGLIYDKYNNSASYTAWAKGQMEYLFGSNKNNQCYMVGYDSNSITEPHHRAASGFDNFPSENRGKKFAHVLVGALVGGPDRDGNYKDEVEEYHYTETGVDYNAAFVGALAGLYLKYGSGQSIDSSVPGVSGSVEKPVVTTPPVTTAPPLTTDKPVQTTTISTTTNDIATTASSVTVVSGGLKSQLVDVNSLIDTVENKNYNIELNKLVPNNAKAQKFIVNLSTNSDMGNGISCGGGVSIINNNWQSLQSDSQSFSGSVASVEFDVSEYSELLDYDNGVFQFSYWWGNQQTINIDSIVCVYKDNSTEVITTASSNIMTTTTPTQTTHSTQNTQSPVTGEIDWNKVIYGDVNVDGKVNIGDVTYLAKYFISGNSFPLINATAKENSDVEYDNNTDKIDLSKLIEHCLGAVAIKDLGKPDKSNIPYYNQ